MNASPPSPLGPLPLSIWLILGAKKLCPLKQCSNSRGERGEKEPRSSRSMCKVLSDGSVPGEPLAGARLHCPGRWGSAPSQPPCPAWEMGHELQNMASRLCLGWDPARKGTAVSNFCLSESAPHSSHLHILKVECASAPATCPTAHSLPHWIAGTRLSCC